jgi:hypothetical protein
MAAESEPARLLFKVDAVEHRDVSTPSPAKAESQPPRVRFEARIIESPFIAPGYDLRTVCGESLKPKTR